MSEALAILGYVIGVLGLGCAVGAVVLRFEWSIQRDDDVAAHASGMDEFSAPEGGREW
jgi:hypothetical protein